ncbi:hypothetical protein [Methanolobus profundi]|uniref:Uncharacterized protein n=1 Tax=Methanolobus profundi TaxID=487685 RepID=A0A1I4NU50_9EURY|nr:hypothetical protein [Methanolobus profundi]SFM19054.1 hypothetical protein SAMN04488696_0265 [Methanolobus profundi]
MTEVNESDRFECVIINVIDTLMWKGVVVEEIESGGRVYFGKVKAEGFNYGPGDVLYVGMKRLPQELEDLSMEVSLYDADNKRLDWTFL